MSTRSTINFGYSAPGVQPEEAKIYKHSDGYTSEMFPLFGDFFETVEEETNDYRYSDPSYLAAKFVVFLTRMYSGPNIWQEDRKAGSMDFLSVGICREDPGDIEYSYWVDCSDIRDGRPVVYWTDVYGPREWKEIPSDQMETDHRRAVL